MDSAPASKERFKEMVKVWMRSPGSYVVSSSCDLIISQTHKRRQNDAVLLNAN